VAHALQQTRVPSRYFLSRAAARKGASEGEEKKFLVGPSHDSLCLAARRIRSDWIRVWLSSMTAFVPCDHELQKAYSDYFARVLTVSIFVYYFSLRSLNLRLKTIPLPKDSEEIAITQVIISQ